MERLGREDKYSTSSKYLQPKTEAEIVSVVRKANENGNQIKVVGSGHSFSSITLTSNDRPNAILLNLDNFNDVIKEVFKCCYSTVWNPYLRVKFCTLEAWICS